MLDVSALVVDFLVVRYATVNGEPLRVGTQSRGNNAPPRLVLGVNVTPLLNALDFTKYEVAESFANVYHAIKALLVISLLYQAF